MSWQVITGDCIAVMGAMGDATIDALVSDPPYELGFMGKRWDRSGIAFNVNVWSEALRVCKPGAHLLAFSGTRTYHRMVCAIEDAGWEIRDQIAWHYATGFPKSLQVADGVGTALKPAFEPIVLARKPFKSTVAANFERYGTGGLNIDACRIETSDQDALDMERCNSINSAGLKNTRGFSFHSAHNRISIAPLDTTKGRWPANIALTHADDCGDVCVNGCPVAELDRQGGELTSGDSTGCASTAAKGVTGFSMTTGRCYADTGYTSRFFFVSKPSRAERENGLGHLRKRSSSELVNRAEGSAGIENPRAGAGRTSSRANLHPTVKPIELMQYLIRLITPKGGIVLDPFCGSGTTGIAALAEQCRFLGIDLNPEYVELARARIIGDAPLLNNLTGNAREQFEMFPNVVVK